MPRSGVYRLAQANGDSEFSQVKKELGAMKHGEMRHIRTSPGRGGLISIKKGKSSPMPAIENAPLKPKAKVIR